MKLTAWLTVHTFRKSFGQNHADNGTPIHVLQQLMGHANIATTREFYIRVAQGSEREAVARYERLLQKPVRGTESEKTIDVGLTPGGVRG